MAEAINPITIMFIGIAVGMLPFLLLLTTSFLKIAVVLALLRNAIGVQQIPPPMALNGLAIVLTVFIMLPVCMDTLEILNREQVFESKLSAEKALHVGGLASGPLHAFLQRHTDPGVSTVLLQTARRIWPDKYQDSAKLDSWIILVPSFAISEISRAFQLGFLLYLPFICIDLVVSNILLAMGMMMVSPMTISLPFKLLLFVSLDGWVKVFQGLILSYR
ncbi:type III secretion system export apparatus subunit SctR [Desulfovibrio sp. OttesenSCG-928-G11]|nr:type III secretion system export apparatus subunit SctR [Desulfovibrio sp. OttesenSCG-928-G11]